MKPWQNSTLYLALGCGIPIHNFIPQRGRTNNNLMSREPVPLHNKDITISRLSASELKKNIKACTLCEADLPFPPKPVFSFSARSKILIVGQAPGIKVQESGIPWNDASGDRLRQWMKVSKEQFYNTKYFLIVPMGFCYPGKGKSGDLPPRPECAEKWMSPILEKLSQRKFTLLIGQYAQAWFLQSRKKVTLTETATNWKNYLPEYFVLPHPSPRNNIWLKKNPWFKKSWYRN